MVYSSSVKCFFLWVVFHNFLQITALAIDSRKEPIGNAGPDPDDWISLGPAKTFSCPTQERKRYPHETQCELFYYCDAGNATLMECGGALTNKLFSEQESFCDFAYLVHCGTRARPPGVDPVDPSVPVPVPSTTTTSTPVTTITAVTSPSTTPLPSDDRYNCTTNGAFPHPKYCELYFDCWEGASTLLKCPVRTLFDTEYFGCIAENQADCGERLRPSPQPIHFDCPDNEDRYYQDPANCAGFFRCVDGISTHYMCPDDLLFNPMISVCDHPQNVTCGARPTLLLTLL